MPTSLSTDTELKWFTTHIDWPYELVFAQAHVLPAKNINPLQRTILEIYQVFDENLPTLEQAAVQLGLVEPKFLEKTLQQMVEQGFLVKEEDAPLNFKHCRMKTDSSEQEENSAAIEKHGVRFCIDAVTSEHIPFVYFELNDQPSHPVIAVDQLPSRRQHLGLDKARQWASDQDEPFIGQTGHVSDMTLLPERGTFSWQSMPAIVMIDDEGQLRCELETGTAAQQDWFEKQDLKQIFYSQFRIGAVETNPFIGQLKPTGFDAWGNNVRQLIAPDEMLKHIADCIRSAKNILVVHGFWLGIESVREAVLKSSCAEKYVFAPNTLLNQIPGISNKEITKLVLEEHHSLSEKILLLADGQVGISLDILSVKTSATKKSDIIVPSLLKQESVIGFKRQLNI